MEHRDSPASTEPSTLLRPRTYYGFIMKEKGFPTKREIHRLTETQIRRLLPEIFEIIGKTPKRPVFTQSEKSKLKFKLEGFFENTRSLQDVDWEKLSTGEAKQRFRQYIEKQLRFFNRIPKDEDAITWYREQMELGLTVPTEGVFSKTSWREYSLAVGWLIDELFAQNRTSTVQSFFDEYRASEDSRFLAQFFVQKGLPVYRHIDRLGRKRLGVRDVQRLVDEYFTLAGIYEKLAQIYAALNRIRKGEEPNLAALKRKTLSPLIEILEREPNLRIITTGVNRDLRNARAHPQYFVRQSDRMIRFAQGFSMTWNEFRKALTELAALVFVLLFTPLFYYFRKALVLIDQATS